MGADGGNEVKLRQTEALLRKIVKFPFSAQKRGARRLVMHRIMVGCSKSELLNRLTTGYPSVLLFHGKPSCAAEMLIRVTLLVLSGTLASKANGGRRVRPRRLPTLMKSTLILPSTRRMKVIATSVVPSAALNMPRWVPIFQKTSQDSLTKRLMI